MRCSGYCIATGFDTIQLSGFLKNNYSARRYREVVHVHLPNDNDQEGEVFFFPYGVLVCWGLTIEQELNLIDIVKVYCEQPNEKICDDFNYTYGATASIKEDEIVLPNHDVLTKLAFSQGIAQSVKLDHFEHTIQMTVDLTRELPERLASQGKIRLSGKDIRRMMGRLFIDRHSINLHQELLDTPEFFWEFSELEPYYHLVANYLDIQRRVNVLNQRLTVLKELFDMLNTEINHKHSSTLEWTIIWLIVIEVALASTDILLHIFN